MKVKNLSQNPNAYACALMLLDITGFKNIDWAESEPANLLMFDYLTPIEQVRNYPAELKLCIDLQHASADKHKNWAETECIKNAESNLFAVIECQDTGLNHSRILFNDFLWNRSKAYYTNYNWTLPERLWYYHCPESFELQPVSQAEQKTRLFLSPNKLGRADAVFRARLTDVVLRYDIMPKGYPSSITWKRDGTHDLPGNRNNPHLTRVQEVLNLPKEHVDGYDPVHNAYYNETFFSVYVETIEIGSTQFVTEKTLDPLIKGHFILPFSTAGFISYLKSQGWRLPDFIDYSYDSILDDELRFRAFRDELFRLCSISMDTWRQLWLDNIDVIEYNRNQLYNRPYDKLSILEHLL